ncbi:hypothetical protein C2845_PM04G13990 [Panicum miliaceum]|uniref:DUF4228 domain protein n=1 Tax=Panicum miliaceum TaxID=4540 RepID=A0A3L6QV04_PANMI|nr:hypothetical protein C2845_PM04G13990 [Panicum miliaceum]
MGNCQAAEAAAVVIQHPGGKVERLYWSTTAAEVMRSNPGHYVALVILRVAADKAAPGDAAAAATTTGAGGGGGGGAKITRVKLLKPKDTLLLGQVYRLITAQEVTKALRTRKNEKMQRCEAIRQQHEQLRRGDGADQGSSDQLRVPAADPLLAPTLWFQDGKQDKDRHRGRGRHWRPALQSISEAASQSSSSSVSEAATS